MNHGVLVISLLLTSSTAFAFAPDKIASEKPGQAATGEQQVDLSGTYEGLVDYPERNLRSTATLTIEGNRFRFLANSTALEGRIITNKTANYIAAVLMFDDIASPTIISVRAVQKPGVLMLTSVPWERHAFSFAPLKPAGLGMGVPEGEKIRRRPARSSSKRRKD
jgi:hypothetical protein